MKLKFSPTIPNILTTIRLIAVPFMAWFIYYGEEPGNETFRVVAFIFFVSIWFTDVVDGFIARRFDQISDFGKIYDPFVDKVFQFTTALMMLIVEKIPSWVVIFMLVKEVFMILGGAYLLQSKRVVVRSKWYGKATTVLFVAALASLFFVPKDKLEITSLLFILPVCMAVFSLVAYGKDSFLGKKKTEAAVDEKKDKESSADTKDVSK